MADAEGFTCACLVKQVAGSQGPDGEALLEVCEEGLAILESLGSDGVSVLAVAGMYRTGKSFFLNRLAGIVPSKDGGKRTAFDVGETTEPCTRGIWLWYAPSLRAADGSRLLLMDTEGLASADQDDSYDAKIFSLGLLLSSYFVLNVVGVIDDATIERLHLVTQVAQQVVVEVTSNRDDETDGDGDARKASALAQHLPPLLVLVRDFALKATKEGRDISAAEYLEDALRDRGGDFQGDSKKVARHSRRDAIRRSLRTLFPAGRRACATLVRPAVDEGDLRAAASLPDEALRPEFVAQMSALRAAIVDPTSAKKTDAVGTAARKVVCGAPCSASALAALAKQHVAAINAGAAPCIRGAWDAASREVCAAAAESAEKTFLESFHLQIAEDDAADAHRNLPAAEAEGHKSVADVAAVLDVARSCAKEAGACFDSKACGESRVVHRKKLRQKFQMLEKSLVEGILERSKTACSYDVAEMVAGFKTEEARYESAEGASEAAESAAGELALKLRGPWRREALLGAQRVSARRFSNVFAEQQLASHSKALRQLEGAHLVEVGRLKEDVRAEQGRVGQARAANDALESKVRSGRELLELKLDDLAATQRSLSKAEAEGTDLAQRLHDLETAHRRIADEVRVAEALVHALQKDAASTQIELESFKAREVDLKDRLEVTSSRFKNAESAHHLCAAQLSSAEAEAANAVERGVDLGESWRISKARATALQADLDRATTLLASRQAEVAGAQQMLLDTDQRLANASKDYKAAVTATRDVECHLAETRNDLSATRNDLAAERGEASKLRGANAGLGADLEAARRERTIVTETVSRLEAQLADSTKRLETQTSDASNAHAALSLQLSSSEEKLASQGTAIADLQVHAADLFTERETTLRLETQVADLEAQLAAGIAAAESARVDSENETVAAYAAAYTVGHAVSQVEAAQLRRESDAAHDSALREAKKRGEKIASLNSQPSRAAAPASPNPVAKVRQMFISGHERVGALASNWLKLVDEELGEDDDPSAEQTPPR